MALELQTLVENEEIVDVCATTLCIPYDVVPIIQSHSSTAALVSGFSLTAFAFLLDGKARGSVNRYGMNLLLTAALLSLITSWLYSAYTGDSPISATIGFSFPSSLFALSAVTLVAGLVALLAARAPNNFEYLSLIHISEPTRPY